MTMPHLMNCAHDGDGWCLKCVAELWERTATLESTNATLTAQLDEWMIKAVVAAREANEAEERLSRSVLRAQAIAAAHICYRVGNHGIRNMTIEQCKKDGTLKLLLTLPNGIDNDAELRMKPLAIEALKYIEENWP